MSNHDENVLLIAYGCEPGRGSEAGIGWAHAIETAKARPTWVVCHPSHRQALDAGIAAHNAAGNPPLHACYVDAGPRMRRLERSGYFGFNASYYGWVRAAAREARRLHDEVGFALAQHVSLSRWWMPSPAAAVAERGVPFLFGPVGAGETMPWAFREHIGLRGHLTEISRLAAREAFRRDPALRRCAALATAGVAEPDETAGRLREIGCRRVLRALSLPSDPRQMADVVPMPKPPGVFRVVSGGGLVYWKSFHLSVRAFAVAFRNDPLAEYVHVLGGREAGRVLREARRWGVADRVRLAGEMPHADTLRWVASGDAYVLPTLRDTTAHLFEALAAGVPCVVSDHLSPRVVVDETCGFRVPVTPGVNAFVATMASRLKSLRHDTALHARLSRGARVRAEGFSREAFGNRLRDMQAWAITRRRRAEAQAPAATLACC